MFDSSKMRTIHSITQLQNFQMKVKEQVSQQRQEITECDEINCVPEKKLSHVQRSNPHTMYLKSSSHLFIINSAWWCMMYCKPTLSWCTTQNSANTTPDLSVQRQKQLLSVSYFTNTATKEGQVQVALTLLHFRVYIVVTNRESPLPREL